MKLIPVSIRSNMARARDFRRGVFRPRPSRVADMNYFVDNRFRLLVVAANAGVLEVKHFATIAKFLQRGLKYTTLGKRKNVVSHCISRAVVMSFSMTRKANGVRMGKGKGGI